MENKKIMLVVILCTLFILFCSACSMNKEEKTIENKETLAGNIIKYNKDTVTILDSNNSIYTFQMQGNNLALGDSIAIEYTGLLDKNNDLQNCQVISYTVVSEEKDENGIPNSWSDNGIFSAFYKLAYEKLQTLSLNEKIGQLLLVRYPEDKQIEMLKKYPVSGFVFYAKDFQDKNEIEVKQMIKSLQEASTIPILTAVDEEGGKVVRVSSNPLLVPEKFKSSSELYALGGFDAIKNDTINKSKILYNLGLNLNLAPVVDVSTNPDDYIYERTLKENTSLTSTYAKTVISASKNTGVSYTLKHFPGYASNTDTHSGKSIDTRTLTDIKNNDLPPFREGIQAGAEAVLVSHNIVNAIDSSNPASLSASIHNMLRNELNFTGIIITDDIAMDAVSSIEDVTVQALLAGNELIITTDYESSFNSIKKALNNGTISEEQIDKLAFRVLSWKYYKSLIGQK